MKKVIDMDEVQRDKQVQRVIVIEGLANLIVLLAKLFAGISSGSLAILADAIHSLTDVINNIVAWVVVRISRQPADRSHPYGHRKFETLAVFFLASLLVVLAFELAMHAITKPETVIQASAIELIVMLAVLLVNIGLATWQRRWARRLESDILQADASHTFADVLTTIVVIVGWQLSVIGYAWLDRICALGVAGLVLYLAYSLFKRVVPVLVDQVAIEPELISKRVGSVHGVESVIRVRSRWIGSERAIDIVIGVDPTLSTVVSHDIATEIEQLLEQEFNVVDVSIHVEPADQ